MFSFIRTNISKIAAPFIAALVLYLTAGLGLPLPAEFAQMLTDLLAMLGAAAAVALVGIVERLIARKTNPANVAK